MGSKVQERRPADAASTLAHGTPLREAFLRQIGCRKPGCRMRAVILAVRLLLHVVHGASSLWRFACVSGTLFRSSHRPVSKHRMIWPVLSSQMIATRSSLPGRNESEREVRGP